MGAWESGGGGGIAGAERGPSKLAEIVETDMDSPKCASSTAQ